MIKYFTSIFCFYADFKVQTQAETLVWNSVEPNTHIQTETLICAWEWAYVSYSGVQEEVRKTLSWSQIYFFSKQKTPKRFKRSCSTILVFCWPVFFFFLWEHSLSSACNGADKWPEPRFRRMLRFLGDLRRLGYKMSLLHLLDTSANFCQN